MKVFVCVLLLCCSLSRLHAAEGGGEGEGGEGLTMPPCAISHERLYSIFPELLSEGLVLFVNCLSFGKLGELEHGVVSGVNVSGGVGGERLFLSCIDGVIAAKPSPLLPLNVTMASTACLECTDSPVEEEICESPCQSPCQRCYTRPSDCTRCIACVDPELEHCYVSEEDEQPLRPASCASVCEERPPQPQPGRNITGRVPQSDMFNFCDCPQGFYRELNDLEPAEEPELERFNLNGNCSVEDFVPDLEDFQCVTECLPGKLVNEEKGFCFACGLEYCFRCSGSVPDGTAQCEVCIEHTVLYEHECFACPRALIALNAIEQEEELEVELEDQRLRQIELAVSLPVLTVLVLFLFLAMSVFAHFRYPHVNPQGHKRHRTKPEDLPSDPAISDDDPARELEPPLSPTDVWRARPTIRLR